MENIDEIKARLHKAFDDNEPRMPLDNEESMFLMSIFLSKDSDFNVDVNDLNKESELYKHFKPLIESFQVQVFLKRLEVMTTIKISVGALILIAMHLESAGNAVMHAYYLNYKLSPNTFITINVYAEKLFPWGMFSPEQLNTIWAKQKLDGKNTIDMFETWKK